MKFRISTWNCFGMAQGFSAVMAVRAPYSKRFRDADVLSECASPDILCVQELLSRDAQQFFDVVGQGHFTARFRDDNRVRFGAGVTMRGCGLGIGARTPLMKTVLRTFSGAAVGWDRLARKGALYTQPVLAGGATIDLITVHLQAGHDAHAVRVRAAQLVDLKALVHSVGAAERPFVVCGDFNVDGLESARGAVEYERLAAALPGFVDLGAAKDLPTFDPHPERNRLAHAVEPTLSAQRLDYIFFRPARGPVGLVCTDTERFFDKPLGQTTLRDGKSAWASDHYGLSATFELERTLVHRM